MNITLNYLKNQMVKKLDKFLLNVIDTSELNKSLQRVWMLLNNKLFNFQKCITPSSINSLELDLLTKNVRNITALEKKLRLAHAKLHSLCWLNDLNNTFLLVSVINSSISNSQSKI